MEGKEYDSPFIHLFETVSGTYFYDVNKDKCVSVPGEIYEYLEKGNDELDAAGSVLPFTSGIYSSGGFQTCDQLPGWNAERCDHTLYRVHHCAKSGGNGR